jgi:hypothetical protein
MLDRDLLEVLEGVLVDGVDELGHRAAVLERVVPELRDLGRELGARLVDGLLALELELVCSVTRARDHGETGRELKKRQRRRTGSVVVLFERNIHAYAP